MNASKYLFGLLLLISVINVQADKLDDDFEQAVNNDKGFFSNIMKCNKYFKSSFLKLMLMVTGGWRGSKGQDSQLKCLFVCLLKETKLIKTETEEINKTISSQRVLEGKNSKQILIEESVKMCEAETAAVSDACEKSYLYIKCMHNRLNEGVPRESEIGTSESEKPEVTNGMDQLDA